MSYSVDLVVYWYLAQRYALQPQTGVSIITAMTSYQKTTYEAPNTWEEVQEIRDRGAFAIGLFELGALIQDCDIRLDDPTTSTDLRPAYRSARDQLQEKYHVIDQIPAIRNQCNELDLFILFTETLSDKAYELQVVVAGIAKLFLDPDLPDILKEPLATRFRLAEEELNNLIGPPGSVVVKFAASIENMLTGETEVVVSYLTLWMCWKVYWLMQRLEDDEIAALYSFIHALNIAHNRPDMIAPQHQRAILTTLQNMGRSDNVFDGLLTLTHHLLAQGSISYEDAANLVFCVTGNTVNPMSWAKRVSRWAERNNRPRIDLRGKTRPGLQSAPPPPHLQIKGAW